MLKSRPNTPHHHPYASSGRCPLMVPVVLLAIYQEYLHYRGNRHQAHGRLYFLQASLGQARNGEFDPTKEFNNGITMIKLANDVFGKADDWCVRTLRYFVFSTATGFLCGILSSIVNNFFCSRLPFWVFAVVSFFITLFLMCLVSGPLLPHPRAEKPQHRSK